MRTRLIVRVLVFLALFACWLVIGVSINLLPQRPVARVQQAQTAWEAEGIDDYGMSITFGSFSFIGGVDLVVQDGLVVEHTMSAEISAQYTERLGATPSCATSAILR